jgi:EpsI family protein
MLVRAAIVTFCLLAGAVVVARASKSEVVPPRESLSTFPLTMGTWQGQRLPDFDEKITAVLGVDEYVNAAYYGPNQSSGVGLYIGYYQSQREGDTMHSPLNCLPGAGWLPVTQERIVIPVTDAKGPRDIEVNNVVIEKGLDRQVVVYWYQSHGRVVASEYWGKIYLVTDAVRYARTDGALVRVVVPIRSSDPEADAAARKTAVEFTKTLFTQLDRYLPS